MLGDLYADKQNKVNGNRAFWDIKSRKKSQQLVKVIFLGFWSDFHPKVNSVNLVTELI